MSFLCCCWNTKSKDADNEESNKKSDSLKAEEVAIGDNDSQPMISSLTDDLEQLKPLPLDRNNNDSDGSKHDKIHDNNSNHNNDQDNNEECNSADTSFSMESNFQPDCFCNEIANAAEFGRDETLELLPVTGAGSQAQAQGHIASKPANAGKAKNKSAAVHQPYVKQLKKARTRFLGEYEDVSGPFPDENEDLNATPRVKTEYTMYSDCVCQSQGALQPADVCMGHFLFSPSQEEEAQLPKHLIAERRSLLKQRAWVAEQVTDYINASRLNEGMRPLRLSLNLSEVARQVWLERAGTSDGFVAIPGGVYKTDEAKYGCLVLYSPRTSELDSSYLHRQIIAFWALGGRPYDDVFESTLNVAEGGTLEENCYYFPSADDGEFYTYASNAAFKENRRNFVYQLVEPSCTQMGLHIDMLRRGGAADQPKNLTCLVAVFDAPLRMRRSVRNKHTA